MYYSYAMGIDDSIRTLTEQGFLIFSHGENFNVSFPAELAPVWEDYIRTHLPVTYWNEYFADDHIVFLFHLSDGFQRYEVTEFYHPEVLHLCETLSECQFGSLRAMLMTNAFYSRVEDPQIRWIFFDVGSTLVDETKAYEHRLLDAIEGTDITLSQIQEKRIEYQKQNLKGDLEAIRHYGLPLTAWHHEDETPYPDAADTLAYLKRKGYQIGVIANQTLGTRQRLQQYGLLPYIDEIIASAEAGISKPDPRLFLLALRLAGCIPKEAVMIGDRLDNDIAPANKLGMHTVWAKQGFAAYQSPMTEEATPEYTIRQLSDLKTLF